MVDMCTDNRFELIKKYKKELIEATNIETSPDEMEVLDNILFRFWQMGWLDKLELSFAKGCGGDTISRQAAVSLAGDLQIHNDEYLMYNQAINNYCAELIKLPPAEPEKTVYIPETKVIPTARSCVDLAEKVTAIFYDEEHEEWIQQTVTIADVLDSVCDDYTILPSAQPQPHWTLVKEKPPEEKGRYLVWTPLAPPKCRITIAEYCGDYWNIKTPVLAWMPLPPFDR